MKNPQARGHLARVSKGDRVLYYHTGDEKAIVGTARAVSDARLDSDDAFGKGVVVDIVPVAPLPRPVTLAQIKADRRFASLPPERQPRLSVIPTEDALWEAIEAGAAEATKANKAAMGIGICGLPLLCRLKQSNLR